ncbi:MAG: DUF1223 domain-containing protein [Rhodospirillaceae bacterium]|nr:DUF1223 domain-containing protein [Rhodospirillaceae bacterium]
MKSTLAAVILSFGAIVTLAHNVNAETAKDGPIVVELFTSQGCYSCPPAEAYLGELSKNPQVVALEFHVDYWDELVYGSAGKWKDVFSQPEFTARQKIYAGNLPKGQAYTPQIVVGGTDFAVGSDRRAVRKLIAKAKENNSLAGVSVLRHSQTELTAKITGTSERAISVWLVRFLKNVTTRVRSGENKGKKLTSHNIVTKIKRLSAWSGKSAEFKFEANDMTSAEGCAVLVQEDAQGPIYGAALCPEGAING